MKKLVRSVLMLSIASIAILSSCSKEDDNANVTDVKIEVSNQTPANPVFTNTPFMFIVTSTGNVDNKVKSISVTRNDNGASVYSKSISGISSVDTVADMITTVGSVTYTIAVTGEKGSPVTKAYAVTAIAPYGTISSTPVGIELNGQTQDSTENYFMKLTDPFTPFDRGRQTFTDNKANIDMCFFYGTANKATLASPDDATTMQTLYSYINWTGAKKSKFSRTSLTVAQFDAVEASASDSAIVAIAGATTTWGVSVNNLAKNDVLVYQTAEGKKGLVLVADFVGTSALTAKITVKVIAQD